MSAVWLVIVRLRLLGHGATAFAVWWFAELKSGADSLA